MQGISTQLDPEALCPMCGAELRHHQATNHDLEETQIVVFCDLCGYSDH